MTSFLTSAFQPISEPFGSLAGSAPGAVPCLSVAACTGEFWMTVDGVEGGPPQPSDNPVANAAAKRTRPEGKMPCVFMRSHLVGEIQKQQRSLDLGNLTGRREVD